MPVNTPHTQYSEFIEQWTRCRDAAAGSDAIKAKGAEYLPILEGMNPAETAITPVGPTGGPASPYWAYVKRAMFYPATGRTILGLIGLVFGKPPTAPKVSEKIRVHFDDVTMSGITLDGFAVEVTREILTTGRAGVLVDYPEDVQGADDDRPYWVLYQAEDIINWSTTRIGGKHMLTKVVLKESGYGADTADEFATPKNIRYRVLRLTNTGPEGAREYSTQIYTPKPGGHENEFLPSATIYPERRGARMDFIPFQFFGPTSLQPTVEHPPLVDMADVNISHYRTSADREHGAHFTAMPTPFVTGHSLTAGQTLGIGSGTAWIIPNPSATVGMVEFSGAGLGALKDIMEEKRMLMATLGARMLETQKNTQEAADTVRMRHAGEGSAIGIMAGVIGRGLTNVTRWHLFWTGMEVASITDDHQITINPEILEELSTDDITKLVAAWQAGAISKKTLFYNLQWGQWTRPDIEFEEEEIDIEEETPDEPTPEEAAALAAAAAAAAAGNEPPPDNTGVEA